MNSNKDSKTNSKGFTIRGCGCLIIIFVIIIFVISAIIGGESEGEQDIANSFTDPRDGKKYKYVTIGSQTWMAENLNYNVKGSRCYDDKSKCEKYGYLYDWATAMGINPKCNIQTIDSCGAIISSPHRGICPEGWHIPNKAEWTILAKFVDSTFTDFRDESGDYFRGGNLVGKKLKAKSGWEGNSFWKILPWLEIYNGTDDYNFSALPGGQGKTLKSQYERTLNSDYS